MGQRHMLCSLEPAPLTTTTTTTSLSIVKMGGWEEHLNLTGPHLGEVLTIDT